MLALALALAVAAALIGYYWLDLRPITQDWGCGDIEPASNDLDAFRAGLPIVHAACRSPCSSRCHIAGTTADPARRP